MVGILSVSCSSDFDCIYDANIVVSKHIELLKVLCDSLNNKIREYMSLNGYDIRVTKDVFEKLDFYSVICKVYPDEIEKCENIFKVIRTIFEGSEVCLIGNIFSVDCVLEV